MIKELRGITLLILILLAIGQVNSSFALSVDELQDKIDESNRNKQALEKEIAKYQTELDTINTQASSLQNTIKTLDLTSNKLNAEIKLTQNNIFDTNLGITNTGIQISGQQLQINKDQIAVRNLLREVDHQDNNTFLETFLNHEELSDFYENLAGVMILQDKLIEKIGDLKMVKTSLETTKLSLEQKKNKLEQYNKDLADQKIILQNNIKEKNKLLAETKNQQSNYQKILADKKALMDAFEKELAGYETQLRLAIDPKSYPKSGKGILSWPLANIFVTQNFGKTSDSGRLYASGSHNGTDFRATVGTKVMSAGNGIVEGTGDTDSVCPGASYGKWVFIRYDNGLASLYGHLSLILVKPGQKVRTGEVVAYSGNTGYSTGPHLHMSLYAGQGVKITTLKSTVCKGTYTMPIADPKAYLDPLEYL